MLVPVITGAQAPPDQQHAVGPRWPQAVLAPAFLASFALDGRPAYALRLAVVAVVLVWGGRLWRPPTEPGVHRWLTWLGAWCLPLGYGLLTAWPLQRALGLHVVFVGAFSTLALAVGFHVTAAHGSRPGRLSARASPMLACGLMMALALLARPAMALDLSRYLMWMTVAAAAFIGAGVSWLLAAAQVWAPGPRR